MNKGALVFFLSFFMMPICSMERRSSANFIAVGKRQENKRIAEMLWDKNFDEAWTTLEAAIKTGLNIHEKVQMIYGERKEMYDLWQIALMRLSVYKEAATFCRCLCTVMEKDFDKECRDFGIQLNP